MHKIVELLCCDFVDWAYFFPESFVAWRFLTKITKFFFASRRVYLISGPYIVFEAWLDRALLVEHFFGGSEFRQFKFDLLLICDSLLEVLVKICYSQ